jgi:hypothetical protein
MATTTTNYGFDIPQSTDLVKDGATAIATLGQDIDTAMNTALGTKKAGMVLLNTTSFSAVASQSISNVFSSAYTNYRILLNLTAASVTTTTFLRLRTASDDTGTNYYAAADGVNWSNGAVNSNLITQSAFIIGRHVTGDTGYSKYNFDVLTPNLAQYTCLLGGHSGVNAATPYHNHGAHWSVTSTQFTGYTIYPNSGTLSGTCWTYGYND